MATRVGKKGQLLLEGVESRHSLRNSGFFWFFTRATGVSRPVGLVSNGPFLANGFVQTSNQERNPDGSHYPDRQRDRKPKRGRLHRYAQRTRGSLAARSHGLPAATRHAAAHLRLRTEGGGDLSRGGPDASR